MRICELFAGAGGASLGGHHAGLELVEAVEYDGKACAVLTSGMGLSLFPAHQAWEPATGTEVVRNINVRRWTPVGCDAWWGSPPCQMWSSAGTGEGIDGWRMVVDLLREARGLGVLPRWALFENVSGMLQKRNIQAFEGYLAELREFFPFVGYWLLDAADYGVPQHRRRVIVWCGPVEPEAPPPTHNEEGTEGLLRWVSMGEALGLNGVFDGGRNSEANPTQERPAPSSEPAPTGGGRGNQMFRVLGGGHNPTKAGDVRILNDITDRPSTTIAAQSGGGAGNAGPFIVSGFVTTGQSSPVKEGRKEQRISVDKPCCTVTQVVARSLALHLAPSPTVSATEVKGSTLYERSDGKKRENRASCRLDRLTNGERRRLTVSECAILQGFPAKWPFYGTKADRYRQVGNAVPPKLAEVCWLAVLRAEERA